MKHIATFFALLSALAAGACSSTGSAADSFNAAPTDMGPGCYDHRNRFERTITTPFECAALTWVWKS